MTAGQRWRQKRYQEGSTDGTGIGWQLADEQTERIWAVVLTAYMGGEGKRVVRMTPTPDWTWKERLSGSLVF